MGSISVEACLTWCVEVSVEELGAHLEAYVNLQPTISILRLCNQFGSGSNANVTKLPLELITQIEEVLLVEERARLRLDWQTAFTCWESRCEPTDHFTAAECLDLYLEYSDYVHVNGLCDCDCECDVDCGGQDCGGCERGWSPPDRLSGDQMKKLDDFIIDMGNPGYDAACDAHEAHKFSWQEKAGKLADGTGGIFSKYEKLILAHFGLKVWVAHTRPSSAPRDHFADYRVVEDGGSPYSTKAYLTMSDGPKATGKADRHFDLGGDAGLSEGPSQASYATPVSMPGPLTPKLLARFKRALRTLQVKPVQPRKSQDVSSEASIADGEKIEDKGEVCTTKSDNVTERSVPDEVSPQLQMLMVTRDFPDGR